MNTLKKNRTSAVELCMLDDLSPFSGAAALWLDEQIALFYVPGALPEVYALSNYDPIGEAQVLSRGIVGDKNGELTVASPLYKQHFSLTTGICFADPSIAVPVYEVYVDGSRVMLKI